MKNGGNGKANHKNRVSKGSATINHVKRNKKQRGTRNRKRNRPTKAELRAEWLKRSHHGAGFDKIDWRVTRTLLSTIQTQPSTKEKKKRRVSTLSQGSES